MVKKDIIKLNESEQYLSLGNIFRLIKSLAIDPNSFLQTDLFSIIFNCDIVANSTVNNYCTGQRAINPKYKNYMSIIKKTYLKDKSIFITEVGKILNLINTGRLEDSSYTIEQINNDSKLRQICSRLYTISKNDTEVSFLLSNRLLSYFNSNDLYNFFVETLFFAVLERTQPLYKNNVLNELIEDSIVNTNISVNDIKKFIQIQLREGIWSIRGINKLANQNNPFACFEMASLEFFGIITGKPRYYKAYDYYKIASDNNHPVASWAIGFLYYNGYIGSRSTEELELAYNYFSKALEFNCPSAFNSIGLVYLRGDIPNIKQDINEAIKYFERGAELGNVYAFNNLGKIAENNKEYDKAFKNYLIAANLGDSWALNKVGEYYRLGIGREKNYREAFNYYELSSNCIRFSLCPWSKYNLAKYFYKKGMPEINVYPDISKAIELLEEISDILIEAIEELIYIYLDLFFDNAEEKEELHKKIKFYISKIELHPKYTIKMKKRIEEKLQSLYIPNIDIDKYLYKK